MVDVLTDSKTTASKVTWLPYQLAWINDKSPRKIVDKSRRVGLTCCEAYDAVSRRFRSSDRRDQDYWFASADESSAFEFIDYCRTFAEMFYSITQVITDQVEDETTKRAATAFVIRCPNDKRITAMTSNPRRFRSKGGDVCLDEFAFHDDQRRMYSSAEPCTKWGGWMRILSTPNGEGTEYHKLVERCKKVLAAMGCDPDHPPRDLDYQVVLAKARELKKTPYFSYHRVTIVDAVSQGLVQKINKTRHTTWTDEAFIQDCRDACLDSESFEQEYMCVAGAGSDVVLPYHVIELCEHDDCPQPDDELTGYTGGICFIGVDVGRTRDLTVIWVLEAVGDVLWTRQIKVVEKTPLPDQEKILGQVLKSVRFGKCCIDQTGIGLGLAEYTQRAFGEAAVEGVQFTEPSKHAMAVGMTGRFADRGLRIPSDNGDLRDDLHSVRKIVTGGHITYKAPRNSDGHADRFWACALALRAAGTGAVGAVNAEQIRSAGGSRWRRDDDDSQGRGTREEKLSV